MLPVAVAPTNRDILQSFLPVECLIAGAALHTGFKALVSSFPRVRNPRLGWATHRVVSSPDPRPRGAASLKLVVPAEEHLPSYMSALDRGWSADNVRGAAAAQEELEMIRADRGGFLASLTDREARGGPVTLPDGSRVTRIPGFRKWLWDGEFCGSISLRWQPGTTALPAHCLGHIGYAVVPWKQGRGYAKQALALFLPEARSEDLEFVELTTDPDNLASQRVITVNGGVFVEHFYKPEHYGGKLGLRYRIHLK